MSIYDYQQAFAAADKTTSAMRGAMDQWKQLYYGQPSTKDRDPGQRIAYTVVNKLMTSIFGEYAAYAQDPVARALVQQLDGQRKLLMQTVLVEGECYIKPCITGSGICFQRVPRSNLLIFARDAWGEPQDVGLMEKSTAGGQFYTLLERRQVDSQGLLTITNALYCSGDGNSLGTQVPLSQHPGYSQLQPQYRFERPLGGLGLVRMKTPMLNCVDGSPDGVAVYGAAAELIARIDENEAQLSGEFARGQSRIIASRDLLRRDEFGIAQLADDLFIGLDEDPERVGITLFSPQLRCEAYLARKQEYLRNVESILCLQRGMLSNVNREDRTATEIAASAADMNLTVIDLQSVWQEALQQTLLLCKTLAELYRLPPVKDPSVTVDWGNGLLFDQDKKWAEYVQLVEKGLLKPEIALGWRFHLPAATPQEQAAIRTNWMP